MQTPAPLRPRHDGWTPDRQWAFIQALADSGSVTAAAARVGMSREAAYRLRRHPVAVDFRIAWDAALVEGWRRVQESAFDRVINGETEVWERDGVTTVRHRPCAPQLVIHMLERASQVQAATHAVAKTQAAKLMSERVTLLRAEIRALTEPAAAGRYQADAPPPEATSDGTPNVTSDGTPNVTIDAMPDGTPGATPDATPDTVLAPPPDAETLVMRRLHTLSRGFVEPSDWDAPADWQRGGGAQTQNM